MLIPGAIVETLEGPTDVLLIDLPTVKQRLGIDAADVSQDAELTRQIEAVGQLYASPEGLGRPLWRQRYRETHPATDSDWLYLAAHPVESVSASNGGAVLEGIVIEDPDRRSLYRADGWPSGVSVEYVAGWLMPSQVGDWQPSTAYSAGAWVRAVARPLLRFQAVTDGQSANAAPPWPIVAGEEIDDGGTVWRAVRASELPEQIRQLALIRVAQIATGGLEIPVGIQWLADPSGSVSFKQSEQSLSSIERAVLKGYR